MRRGRALWLVLSLSLSSGCGGGAASHPPVAHARNQEAPPLQDAATAPLGTEVPADVPRDVAFGRPPNAL